MKKKIALLLSFVLAFALALGVFAGCSKNKGEEVTVYISKTELSVEVQKTGKLTATASDGSDIVWSSSDETVATVSSNGTVTGVKAGSATVTATVKDGTAKADCAVTVTPAVTFTFTQDGTAATTLSADRNTAESFQVGATASDGSSITSWEIADTSIATVENNGDNTGTVTIVKDGTTTLTVRTTTGNGAITLTVTDSATGDKYQMGTDTTVSNKWFYNKRTDGGRTATINQAEFREDKAIFDVSGDWNWSKDSLFLGFKNTNIEDMGHWYKLSMNINSSVTTSITIHDTVVDLKAGDNSVAVCYEQWEYASIMIYFTGGDNTIKLEISNVNWDDTFEPVDLITPSFTLSGNNITITDNDNTEGVKEYQVGLFKDGATEPSINRTIIGKSGTIDTSTVEGKNGTYTVRIKAIGVTGYNDSEWTTTNEYTHTINNADISYKLTTGTDPQKKGNGKGAVTSGRWEYLITDIAEGVVYEDAYYENGAVTFKGTNGWAADTVQLMRHYSEYAAGTELKVTMTLKASATGKIRVCGEVVALVANEAKTVTVTVTQSGEPTIAILLGVVAENDAEWPGKLLAADSMQYGPITFTVSNVSVEKA